MFFLWVFVCLGLVHAQESRVWEKPRTPVLDAKALGLAGLQASDCGVCHTKIYEEWRTSVHAAAWIDPQFQAELHKDPEVAWLCLNCHTPLSNQQVDLVQEGGTLRKPKSISNSHHDAQLQQEGVTCLACHWRPEGIAVAHADVQAPHATVYDADLSTDAMCVDCHQARARLEEALVCHFNTGEEKRAAGVTQACSSCHMPRVRRPAVDGGPVRSVGRHDWPGSGIGKGHADPVSGLNGLDIDATWSSASQLQVSLRNARAGHMVPTGDPERSIEVRMRLLGPSGDPLLVRTETIGQVWQWSPVAKQVSDNRIDVGETRRLDWAPSIPASATKIEVTVHHIRLSESNLRYHLDLVKSGHPGPSVEALQSYPTQRVLFAQEWAL